ncbi:nuclear mitotic apparatus protein 1-like [Daktulosphaira vitifoliae]|uniref:nuclear mitotic apparatus protein 1-like n=1 Tax=Daktulosphaira vitifoliae TaxID=58002 RepID=UPI0021AAE597|nr:nuclear mitotic apparatus protein 1-like [Daktulosphaira vitifoliae]
MAKDHSTDTMLMYDEDISSFCQQTTRKKKLTLTPELRRSSFAASLKTQCCYSNSRLVSLNGLDSLKNSTMSLDDNVDLINEKIMFERQLFQDYMNELRSQAVQLEADIYLKSTRIDDLQLYNCEKLNVIGSLAAIYDETRWRCESIQRLCDEHAIASGLSDPYRCALLVDRALDMMAVFKSDQQKLREYMNDMSNQEDVPYELVRATEQLYNDLEKCVTAVKNATGREMTDALLNDIHLDDTIKNVIQEIGNIQEDIVQPDYCTAIELIDQLQAAAHESGPDAANNVELWTKVRNLFKRNQCLAHKVTSLNMHKTELQLQLDEMTESAEKLEKQTELVKQEVRRKSTMLDLHESMIEQHWDEINTSTDVVIKSQQNQEISQELEDLQLEFDNLDLENRQFENELVDLKDELTEYQIKCDSVEKEIQQLEKQKVHSLDEYAKSWGHHNAKQKIKYTGKLIKDLDTITQEIKLLELELENYEENVNMSNDGSAFVRSQPKSEKIPRSFGLIDPNKRHSMNSVFRENVVRKIRYQ